MQQCGPMSSPAIHESLPWRAIALSLLATAIGCASSDNASPRPSRGDRSNSAGEVDMAASGSPGSTQASRVLDLVQATVASDPLLAAVVRPQDDSLRLDGSAFNSRGWRATDRREFDKLAASIGRHSDQPAIIGLSRFARYQLRMTPIGSSRVEGEADRGRVVYRDAYRSTDLVWAATDHRAEALLVLRDESAPTEYSWELQAGHGMPATTSEPSGGLAFTDAAGDAVLRVVAPFAIDARGTRREATLSYDGGILRIRLPAEGLQYPIVLDPAIETGTWLLRKSISEFPTRYGQLMAYSPATGTCLFGGSSGGTWMKDFWCWNPSGFWTTVTPPVFTVAPAYGASMTRGPDGLYLYYSLGAQGGSGIKKYTCPGGVCSWSNVISWPYQGTCVANGPEGYGRLAYDFTRSKFVLLTEKWNSTCPAFTRSVAESTNASSWTVLTGAGAQSFQYWNHLNSSPVLAHHAGIGQVVWMGGYGNTATMGWNGSTWSTLVAATPMGIDAAAYDEATRRMIMVAAVGGTATYSFDGSAWKNLNLVAPTTGYAMAWDTARGRGVLTTAVETWEYRSRGTACTANADCDASNYCVDGVCCELQACGTCEACDTAANPGRCAPLKNQEDTNGPGFLACTGSSTCDATGACKLKPGSACTVSTGCITGYCVDGVCCDSPCTGNCQACSATAKGSGADGVCGLVKAGADPRNVCPDETGGNVCGRNGSCDGLGNCQYVQKGTSCGPTTCQGNTLAQQSCDGLGACELDPGKSKFCSPYACNGDKCADPCATSSDCLPGNYCEAGACKPSTGAGKTCSQDLECSTGHCVDHVCCNTACPGAGQCMACTAALKGQGVDGECGPVVGGKDPNEFCAATDKNTCGLDGSCDGLGGCREWPMGTACGSSACEGTFVVGQVCDGQGQCLVTPSGALNCAPYLCENGACVNPCDQCLLGSYCSQGVCTPQVAAGQPCDPSIKAQCQSGNCVDGVCCNSECNGECLACLAAKTGGQDGLCAPISSGTDPDQECPEDAKSTCQRNGTCDGHGACALWPGNTQLTEPKCLGDSSISQVCDGFGQPKLNEVGADCAQQGYGCDKATGACKTSCTSNADCASNGQYACMAGVCIPKIAQGEPCTEDAQCQSGSCADKVCCNTTCNATCERCNGATKGVCTPIEENSPPEPGRAACKGGSTLCAGRCDGVSSNCVYPGATTTCDEESSCGNSVETPAVCDGNGACQAAPPRNCTPYSCDSAGKRCLKSCKSNDDCASGSECNLATGQCAATDKKCKDDGFTSVSPGGAETSCLPYRCAAGMCMSACSTSSDCAPGYDCSAARCTLAGADAGEGEPATAVQQDKGCGCQSPGRGPIDGRWLLVAASLLAIAIRRSSHRQEVHS